MNVEPAESETIAPNGQEAADQSSALDELRGLLFGQDRRELKTIQQRLDDPALHARDVSKTLAQAFSLRPVPDPSLADAMAPTLQEAFKVSVRKDPQTLVDAISPVMGPAIRKSISDALERMVQSLNQTLEYGFSPKSFKWRIEAYRTGKSFAEVVMLHTLQFRVEQVFLIHRKTGLLLQHVSADAGPTQDADMVSGMLTAIQDFVRDSFGGKEEEALDQARVGELTIWIEQAPQIILAVVVRGSAPQSLRSNLKQAAEQIQLKFGGLLHDFEGDSAPFEASRPDLESCLLRAARDEEKPAEKLAKKRSPWIGRIVVLIVLGAIGSWIFLTVRSSHRWRDYLDRLGAEPGIVLTASGKRDGQWYVRGLRDPMAIDPDQLAAQCRIPRRQIQSQWEPYDSFNPAFSLARARTALNPPAGVEMQLRGGVLHASGVAPGRWIAEAKRLAPLLPGISQLDAAGLVQSDRPEAVLRAAKAALKPPPDVHLSFSDGALLASGTAQHAWIALARRAALNVAGVSNYDDARVVDADNRSWIAESNRLESISVDFAPYSLLIQPGQQDVIEQAGDAIRKLSRLSMDLGVRIQIVALGHLDSTFRSPELARLRARRVLQELNELDAPSAAIVAQVDQSDPPRTAGGYVSFAVTVIGEGARGAGKP